MRNSVFNKMHSPGTSPSIIVAPHMGAHEAAAVPQALQAAHGDVTRNANGAKPPILQYSLHPSGRSTELHLRSTNAHSTPAPFHTGAKELPRPRRTMRQPSAGSSRFSTDDVTRIGRGRKEKARKSSVEPVDAVEAGSSPTVCSDHYSNTSVSKFAL